MRGKIARKLRKIAEAQTGVNPIGSTPKYTAQGKKKKDAKGHIWTFITKRHDLKSSRGIYKTLKREWKENNG